MAKYENAMSRNELTRQEINTLIDRHQREFMFDPDGVERQLRCYRDALMVERVEKIRVFIRLRENNLTDWKWAYRNGFRDETYMVIFGD